MFEIRQSIVIQTTAETLFRALTEPDLIVQYFPYDQARSEATVGGAFELSGSLGGQAFTDFGVIEVLEPFSRFQYRYWSDNHGTERRPENYLTIAYSLHSFDERVELRVTQSNIGQEAYYQIMLQVWPQFLAAFKAQLEG